MSTVDSWYAADQQDRAKRGMADGQCQQCKAFRIDGQPPTVHRTGCPMGPDGVAVGVVSGPTGERGMNPVKRKVRLDTPPRRR
jgi:hypothetical protein